MKSYLICGFLFCTVLVISAKKCLEQSECGKGQCCSGIPPFGGLCRNLTAEGKKCHIEPKTVPMFGDFVIGPCPCVEGLQCTYQGGKKENNGICQVPVSTTLAPEPIEKVTTENYPVEESAEDVPVKETSSE